jgi:hypothetical protein
MAPTDDRKAANSTPVVPGSPPEKENACGGPSCCGGLEQQAIRAAVRDHYSTVAMARKDEPMMLPH